MKRCVVALAVLATCGAAAHAQGRARAIEEWQIKGIAAALDDGYAEVREKAMLWLAQLFERDGGAKVTWLVVARDEARKLVPRLLELFDDQNRNALRALALLAREKVIDRATARAVYRKSESLHTSKETQTWQDALAAVARLVESGMLNPTDVDAILARLPELVVLSEKEDAEGAVNTATERMG